MDSPEPFITSDEDMKPVVNEKMAEIIASVEQPLTIIAIAGKYRTGKSYLLNRLMGQMGGFPLGSTVEAKTKGIWVWLGSHPKDSKRSLLLMDTEGLHDPDRSSRDNDTWIFTVAILLSSTFVYNSVGTIDNASINELHLAAELTKHLMVKTGREADGTEFASLFPMFVWAVRDFFLEQTIDGRKITSNEYLEHCLAPKKGRTPEINAANSLKGCIRSFFVNRHCFVFPRPVSGEEKLRQLDLLKESDLDKNFLESSKTFTEFIYDKADVKKVKGTKVNGSMFVNLSKCYVQAIRDGKIPCIESAVTYITKIENTKALEKAIEVYNSEIAGLEFPVDGKVLEERHSQAQKKASERFSDLAILDENQECYDSLRNTLSQRYIEILAENEESSVRKCRAILEDLYREIEKQITSGVFLKPGGYESYRNQMDKLEKAYRIRERKGFKANDVFDSFMKEKEVDQLQILNADKKLTEEEREKEEQRLQTQKAEREAETLQQNLEWTKNQIEVQKKQYQDMLERQRKDYEAKLEEECLHVENTMKRQMEQMKRTLQDGFEEEAALMNEEIKDLKKDLEERKQDGEKMRKYYNEKLENTVQEMETRRKMELQHQKDQFEANIEENKEERKKLKKAMADLEATNHQTMQQIKNQMDVIQQQKQQVEEERKKSERDRESLQKEIKGLIKENKVASEAMSKHLRTVEDQLSRKDAERAECDRKTRELQAELANIKSSNRQEIERLRQTQQTQQAQDDTPTWKKVFRAVPGLNVIAAGHDFFTKK